MNVTATRRKLYLVLDCETATLPCVSRIAENERQKQNAAIAKPLIYDLGWKIVDRDGNTYTRKSFLIREIFMVPEVFNTAYYKEKRPLYLNKLKRGEIQLVNWADAIAALDLDMKTVYAVGAYNAMFDFKKAIPFTELYMNMQFEPDFPEWLDAQEKIIRNICAGAKYESKETFEPEIFRFHDHEYKLFDLWGIATKKICNTKTYKKMCIENLMLTSSLEYFSTSAEAVFRYITLNTDFNESHTAIEDAEIESEILRRALSKGKIPLGISYFPFRDLGTTVDFFRENPKQYKKQAEIFIEEVERKANSSYGLTDRQIEKMTRLVSSVNYWAFGV